MSDSNDASAALLGGDGSNNNNLNSSPSSPLLVSSSGSERATHGDDESRRGGMASGSDSVNATSPLMKSQYTAITPERFSAGPSTTTNLKSGPPLPASHYYHSITAHDDPFSISRVSVSRLIASQLFMYAYGLWISSYAIVTLPAESERMFKHDHDIALAGFLAIAGATQLVGPIAGFFSDKTRTTIGRRRPYLVLGGLVVLPSLLIQWFARGYPESSICNAMYITAFATSMLALNVMYTAASGVIPDMYVPPFSKKDLKQSF